MKRTSLILVILSLCFSSYAQYTDQKVAKWLYLSFVVSFGKAGDAADNTNDKLLIIKAILR